MTNMHVLSYSFIVLGVVQLITAVNYLIRPRAFFDGWLRDVFRMRGKRMKPYLWLRQGVLAFTGAVYVAVGSPLVGEEMLRLDVLLISWPAKVTVLLVLLAAELGTIFALNRYFTGRIVLTK